MQFHSSARTCAVFALGLVAGLTLPFVLRCLPERSSPQTHAGTSNPSGSADLSGLQADVASLKGQIHDQSHAMVDVGYHFTNLWFAAQKKNWALASFYIDETSSHLAWAVRMKPIRKDSLDHDVNLPGILEAVDNSLLAELKKAIQAKDSAKFAVDYRRTLEGCYSCHKASDKPYLRPQVPEGSGAQIINFDPDAAWPQ
jgi:hypothetical protein